MDKNLSLKVGLNVWYEEKSGIIKLAGGEPDNALRSTVSNNPKHERYHPNLYRKLARVLRNAGKPSPDISAEG
jgi:hypothetical protein